MAKFYDLNKYNIHKKTIYYEKNDKNYDDCLPAGDGCCSTKLCRF